MQARADNHTFQTGRVSTIAAGHAIHDTYTAFLPPLLPLFIERLLLSKTEAGLLVVFLQGPSLVQPVIGHLADRVDLRYAVILAPAVSSILMSSLGIAPGYAALALLLLLAGCSAAAFHAVGPVMAGTLSGRSLGRGMGLWMLGGEMGRMLGPIVAVSSVGLVTLKGMPSLIFFGMIASGVIYARLKDVPVRPPNQRAKLPWQAALKKMRPVLIPLSGVIIVRAFLLSALVTFLPVYLIEEGSGFWLAGVSLSIYEAAGVAGALTGGWMSDKLGRRSVIAISMIATPLAMFAFLLSQGWLRFVFLLTLGFTGLSIAPVIMALVQERFPEHRAFANGIYMFMSFGVRALAVVVIGVVGDVFGLRIAFLAGAAVMLLGLPLILLMPPGPQKQMQKVDNYSVN
jgi:FSR family fosmidomycin resistance protein-like MFS transporter